VCAQEVERERVVRLGGRAGRGFALDPSLAKPTGGVGAG
jgi:hypothetical protein